MKSVVVCASKRYQREVGEFCDELEQLGVVVFRPNISEPIPEETKFQSDHVTRMVFKGLTLEHFDWIRKSDVCFVYNKDDYAGTSVSLEMGYAAALGKPTYALTSKTGDPCRDCLIDKVAQTPQALAKLLA
jgi:nucleoside 2-deoxyribosyltransferase